MRGDGALVDDGYALMTVEFQVRRGLGLQARHPNFLLLSGIEASADQNEVYGVRTRHVDGMRSQERALNGAQENKALPVAESRPGDPLIKDGDDPALLLSRSRLDAEPQQGEQARKQAGQSREREHCLPTILNSHGMMHHQVLGLPVQGHRIGPHHQPAPACQIH